MTAFIEEAPIYIPGDAWAHYTAAGKQTEAQELDSLVQQYLTQGGSITELPAGATSDESVTAGLRAQLSTSQFTAEEHIAHTTKRRRRATLKDLALVAHIEALLPADTRAALVKAVGISDGKLVRLMRDHLSHKPEVQALLASRWDSDAKLDKVREALDIGLQGYEKIRKYAGISYNHLKKLEREHRLRILKGVGGFRKREEVA